MAFQEEGGVGGAAPHTQTTLSTTFRKCKHDVAMNFGCIASMDGLQNGDPFDGGEMWGVPEIGGAPVSISLKVPVP